MSSTKLLSSLVLLFYSIRAGSGQEAAACVQCATPNMKENWAATGLPIIPSGMVFTDKCVTPGVNDQINLTASNCASSCFEMLLPIEQNYAIVRGCHENFVWPEFAVKATNTSCESNLVPDYGTVQLFADPAIYSNAYTAMSFCEPAATLCNKNIVQSVIGADGVAGCTSGVVQTCKSCSRYDGDGDCDAKTSNTCKGVYCTKTIGTLNGYSYESRGCAGINPYTKDVCSWTYQLFNVTTNAQVRVSTISKRSVTLAYQANQCYCKGELCNSSRLILQLFPIILSPFFVSLRVF